MRKTKRFTVVATSFMLTVSMLFAGCGAKENEKKGSAGNDTGDKTQMEATIRFAFWVPEQEAALKQSIAEFNKVYPNIKVECELTQWNQYWTKLQTELAGGTAPDVFMNQTFYFLTLQDSNAAEPLNEYIEKDNVDMSQHNQKVIDIYTKDDNLYVMPQDWDSECVIYNKDLFDKYGIDYPTELDWNPIDGGSFTETAQKLTVDKNGRNALDPDFDASNIDTYGFLTNNSNNCFYWNFMYMNGGDIDKYDDPKNIETMNWAQELITKYKVSPEVSQVSSMGVDSMFATGSVGMYTMGNWVLKTLEETCDFNWGVAMMPTGPDGRATCVNGVGQSIYSGSKNKEAAWELVKWFGSDESQKIMGETGTVLPSREAYHQSFIDFYMEKGIDISAFKDSMSEAETFIAPIVPNWNQKSEAVTKNYDLLFMNKITSREAAENIAKAYAEIGD